MPAEVAAVDAAILMFGAMFPVLGSHKHRVQLLEHFHSTIQSTKQALRR